MSALTQAHLDQAQNHGIEFALEEISKGYTSPGVVPIMVYTVAVNAGLKPHDLGFWRDAEETYDAWETGYYSTWSVQLSEHA